MSSIKVSQLTDLTPLNPNTSNVAFVASDTESGVTGKITAYTLAQGLYANNVLNVGNNAVIFPGVIAQFASNNESYLQLNLQNLHDTGSGDIVITGDTGTDETNFIDMGIQGSNLEQGVLKPLDGYLLIKGDTPTDPGANLVIGTLTQNRDIVFTQGGYYSDNVVAKFVYDTGLQLVKKPLTFADGTTQNTSSISASTYANSAFAAANSAASNAASAGTYANGAFALANSVVGVNTTQNTSIGLAWTKANNALANATGTFAGDLTITGNTYAQAVNTGNFVVVGTAAISGTANMAGQLNVAGAVTMDATVLISNSTFSATEAAVTIAASGTVVTPANDGYMIHISGKDGVASRVVTDSYGTGAYSLYAGRAARGTVTSPTALQSGDVIARFSSNGYGTTKYQTLGVGRIDFLAAENFTDTATGSQIKFWNCPIGSNILTNILTLNGDSATFTGVVNPEKGFIYTPRVPAGNQTAITIDYATDSMIKANLVADLTVSHSNYVSGKVVEMWLTNNDNSNHTVTHGCAALRSTNKATTFTITSGSSAYLRFFSIDGDNANTFVTVTA